MTHPLRQFAAGLRHAPATFFWLGLACAAASACERLSRLAVAADHRAGAHESRLHEATGMNGKGQSR